MLPFAPFRCLHKQVFVPTPETVSLRYLLDMMVALRKPIMFVGGPGTVRRRPLGLLSLLLRYAG